MSVKNSLKKFSKKILEPLNSQKKFLEPKNRPKKKIPGTKILKEKILEPKNRPKKFREPEISSEKFSGAKNFSEKSLF